MDPARVREAFLSLKPVCDDFLKNPTSAKLASIKNICKNIPNDVLQEISAFLLFPATIHLKNLTLRSKTTLLMHLVDFMNDIFCKTRIETLEQFQKYFVLLVHQLFERNSTSKICIKDEDFALVVMNTLLNLTLNLPLPLRIKIYYKNHAPQLGQGIYLCIQVANSEKYVTLRTSALQLIMVFCTVHDDLMQSLHSPRLDPTLSSLVGDIVMFFLPGLVGGLQEVATANDHQAHIIPLLAVRAIRRIICLVIMDSDRTSRNEITSKDFINLVNARRKSQHNGESDPFGKKLKAKGYDGMMEHIQTAKRDKEWYKAASEKLTIVVKFLMPIQQHPHAKVRLEMAYLCEDIISYCPKNMYSSMQYILGILVPLSYDKPEIAEATKKSLFHFRQNNFSHDGKQLSVFFEENFNDIITKLPRMINYLDESVRLNGLQTLCGYIHLMTMPDTSPQKLTAVLSSPYILARFIGVLVEIFKMDVRRIKVIDEVVIREIKVDRVESLPWKDYLHFTENTEVGRKAFEICKLLGASEAVEIIVDYLLDQFREDNECKKEVTLLLNEIVTAPCKDMKSKEHLIKDVMFTYLELENWYLPIAVHDKTLNLGEDNTFDISLYDLKEWSKDFTPGLYEGAVEVRYTDISYRPSETNEDNDIPWDQCRTPLEAKNNILKICIMTDGLGLMAKALRADFQPYLLKTLYLVLERAGSYNRSVHLSGMRCLQDITEACGLGSITELIKRNADYFTHHLNLKLRTVADNPEVLSVMYVVMKFSDTDVLPCLYEIISNVLKQCTGLSCRHKQMILFLRLFYKFLMYIKAKFPYEAYTLENKKNISHKVMPELIEYQKNRLRSEDVQSSAAEDEVSTDLGHQELEETDVKKVPPIYITMVVSVVKKSLNFLPSTNRDEKILAIEILKVGVTIVKHWEDELLPLVHLIWSPLVIRFQKFNEPVIINRAFNLLVVLAEVSKEFLRNRIIKEVLPSICQYLSLKSRDSHMKDAGSSYRHTQVYKLQLCLLEGLPQLCVSIGVQEKEMHEVMEAAGEYLSCKQPKPLQEECWQFFEKLMVYDLAGSWLFLYSKSKVADLQRPSFPQDMSELQLPDASASNSSECTGNVNKLLLHRNREITPIKTKTNVTQQATTT